MGHFGRNIAILVSAVAMTLLTGCSAVRKAAENRLREIKLTSFKVDRITPRGLRALDATFYVGIYNPSVKITLEDVNVRLFHRDREIGVLVLDPFTIDRREERVYLLSASAELSSAGSLLEVIGALGGGSADDFTVSVTALGKGAGIRREISREMPLKELINMVRR